MVSRSEVDLFNIRKEFKETHDVSLHEFIQVETMIVSPSICLLTLLAAEWCSHLISSHLCVCLLGTFSFLISWPLPACSCVAHPSSVAVVKGYSFLRWSMGLSLLHSCSGISPRSTSSLCQQRDWLIVAVTGSLPVAKSPWHQYRQASRVPASAFSKTKKRLCNSYAYSEVHILQNYSLL